MNYRQLRLGMLGVAAFSTIAATSVQASAKSNTTKIQINKLYNDSKTVRGIAPKYSTVTVSRYKTVYAKGKTNKQGKFNIKLRHKLSANWKYRVTIKTTGKKAVVKHVKVYPKPTSIPTKSSSSAQSVIPAKQGENASSSNLNAESNIKSSDTNVTTNGQTLPSNTKTTNTTSTDTTNSPYPSWLPAEEYADYDKYSKIRNDNISSSQVYKDKVVVANQLWDQLIQISKKYGYVDDGTQDIIVVSSEKSAAWNIEIKPVEDQMASLGIPWCHPSAPFDESYKIYSVRDYMNDMYEKYYHADIVLHDLTTKYKYGHNINN